MKMTLKTMLLSIVGCGFALLLGCEHTVEGFGQDMQNTGKAIQKSVDK